MNALSTVRLSDMPMGDLSAAGDFGLARCVSASPASTTLLTRLWERFAAAWHPEPELSEMGPSQMHELMVMRGRD